MSSVNIQEKSTSFESLYSGEKRIYNLFCEIFKFCNFKKVLWNFAKYIFVHIFANEIIKWILVNRSWEPAFPVVFSNYIITGPTINHLFIGYESHTEKCLPEVCAVRAISERNSLSCTKGY